VDTILLAQIDGPALSCIMSGTWMDHERDPNRRVGGPLRSGVQKASSIPPVHACTEYR